MTAPEVWSTTTGHGDGAHVVLIHGSLDRSAGLLKLSRRLDERYLVTRYDRRGYGRSLPVGAPFDVEHQVDDLMMVIDGAVGSDAPSLLFGHSFGGNVALAAAQRHPHRVSGVVVYETPLSWLDWWPTDTAAGLASESAHDPYDAAERFMRRLVGDDVWERLPAATREARRSEGPALTGELVALAERVPWTVDGVHAPVLPMRGEHCKQHHLTSTLTIAEWFGVEPAVIVGARHFGPNTHPDQVADAFTAWVNDAVRRS